MLGRHNAENALRAVAAVCSLGTNLNGRAETIKLGTCAEAASSFGGVARRMQKLGQKKGLVIYDDFAHHRVLWPPPSRRCAGTMATGPN